MGRGINELAYCEKCGFDTWHKHTSNGLVCLNCEKKKQKKESERGN